MARPRSALALILILALTACRPGTADRADDGDGGSDPAGWALVLEPQQAATDALLQAVSPVDARVVWVSGHAGTWARSTDGGSTWAVGVVPGADSLQFRDVAAVDSMTAVLMSAGTGSLSRIFRTDDGGTTWSETFVMDHPDGFLDCMAFLDGNLGLVYGDSTDGQLYLLRTTDGGRSWSRVPADALPEALDGEGGFAASGSCVAAELDASYWVATGAGSHPRLLTSHDAGDTWSVQDLPLAAGPSAGATTVGFLPDGRGFALGGVIDGDEQGERVALSPPESPLFEPGGPLVMSGPVYGAAWVRELDAPTLVAVGPGGMDWSRDGGRTWASADTVTYWAVEFASPDAGWAVGPAGRITHLRVAR